MLHKLSEAKKIPAQQLAIILADADTSNALEQAAQHAAFEVDAAYGGDMQQQG